MSVKIFASVLLIVIMPSSLVITLMVCYNNYYYMDVDIHTVVAKEINPNSYVSKMNSMVTSQGMQCRKISYTKADKSLIKRYWELIDEYSLFHREGVRNYTMDSQVM